MENPEIKRFGRYEIVAELGRGAMGIVYKARDPQIDRIVALKTVPLRGQEPEAEEEYRRRFLNEAQAAGRLHHPGIVAVFDVGEDPETHDPYIVLEYVAGEALNRILAREKKLLLATGLQFAAEIADALDYAHAKGVTHRDIKPGNILVTRDGHPKIADFGIAKLNLAHFTVPGKVLGTPAYMAPEQLNGEAADGRADLFSLGVILYAMVTGHSPFQGDSATTVCFKVANREPVPASALDLNLPSELDAVIARAMAKDPAKRYQRGAEFAGAVRQLQTLIQPGPTTTSLRAPSTAAMRKAALGHRLNGHPAVGLAYAAKLVRATVLKAPVKDLVLGVLTVVLLVIVGVQSKLLIGAQEEAADPGQIRTQPVHPDPNHPDPLYSSQVQASAGTSAGANARSGSPANSAAATKATVGKASVNAGAKGTGSPVPQPVKQVVVALATVNLAVQHQFRDATLSVWVDDKLVLTRPLHGGTQKRLVVFSGIRGVDSQTLQIPAGKHVLRVRALSADRTIDLSRTVAADFIGGADKSLQVTIDKHNTVMRLSWQ